MTLVHKKIAALGLVAGSILLAGSAAAGDGGGGGQPPSTDIFNPPHIYLNPSPNALTYSIPDKSGATAGIPYSWTVNLGQTSTAAGADGGKNGPIIFGFFVGALSWHQPTFTAPNYGWTHNTNWIALNLAKPTIVIIEVGPSVPIPCQGTTQPVACADGTGRTGTQIYPAISLYQGQDATSIAPGNPPDDHIFNPTGNFWATGLNYLDSSYRSDPVTHVLTYKKWLPAGKYTLNIGSATALYVQDCSATTVTDPLCISGKSYQAQITTSSTW